MVNGCQGNTTVCDGRDVRPVKLGLRTASVVPMCAACRMSDVAVVAIVERRVAIAPVALERRRFVPAWLRNLTARDETGRVVAG